MKTSPEGNLSAIHTGASYLYRTNLAAAVFVSFYFPFGLDKWGKVLYTIDIEGNTSYSVLSQHKPAT